MIEIILIVMMQVRVGQVECKDKIDPAIVEAIVQWESGGRPTIEGLEGDRGLMQVTHLALKDYNKRNEQIGYDELFQVRKNLRVGIWTYCRAFIRQKGDLIKSLMEYHGGAWAVRDKKRDKEYLIRYAENVIKAYKRIKRKREREDAKIK